MSRSVLFITFFGTLLLLVALMQWRIWRAYRVWVNRAVEPDAVRRWLRNGRLALAGVNVLFVSRFVFGEAGHYEHPFVQLALIYPGGIIFGGLILSFLVLSVGDLFRGFRRVAGGLASLRTNVRNSGRAIEEYSPMRRRILKLGGIGAAGTLGAVPLISSAATAHDYQVNRITLDFDSLPPELNGMTVAQVSDIHSGIYMTEKDMAEIFGIVRNLRADLVLLTGDQVDNSDAQIPPLARALPILKADLGVYGCLGNHDHFATAEKVTAAMEHTGVTVLNNSHRILRVNGSSFAVAGVDDAGRGARNFARLDESLAGIPPGTFRILLTHRPGLFVDAKEAGVDFSLAGHTHGGQVGIEVAGINLNPVYLMYDYARGLYREEGKVLYVNVGVGMVGVPIRFVRPEIALFTLRSGGNGASGHQNSAREQAAA